MVANHMTEAVAVSLAAARAAYRATAPRIEQPRITADMGVTLLMPNYLHGGELYLDLYGYDNGGEGCEVLTATEAGRDVSLDCLIQPEIKRRMERAADRWMSENAPRLRKEAAADAACHD